MPRLPRTMVRTLALLVSLAAGLAAADEVSEVRELLARGEPGNALERIERAGAQALKKTPPLRFLRGVALMDLQRNAEAMASFEAMAQDYPQLPDPWNNIALLHVREHRLEQARLALETALRNDPSYGVARANLGLVHMMLAVRAWEQAAAQGQPDPLLARRLELARALLATTAR